MGRIVRSVVPAVLVAMAFGVSLGAETKFGAGVTLTKATRAEVIAQVRMSSDAIYEAVGRRPITLAYPGGAYNTAVMDAVRSEGSTWMAFSVEYGCSESWSTRLHEQRMIIRHDFISRI